MLLGRLVFLYGVIFHFFNFRFEADKMFDQPRVKTFASASANTIPLSKLVIGVALNGEAIEGKLKNQRLAILPAYQEFWHSWNHFHPATARYQ